MNLNLQKAGFITKPHGFKGHLQVKLLEELTSDWHKEPVFFELQGQPVPFFIDDISKNKGDSVVIHLKGINTEAEALSFKGKELLTKEELIIEYNELPDLIGWKFTDTSSGKAGVVEDVMANTHQIILQTKVDNKEVLIPLSEDFITEVDEESKKITFDLPPGLIDIYLK